MFRVNLASGPSRRPGWLNVDATLDAEVQMDLRCLTFDAASVDEILVDRALHRFSIADISSMLGEVHRVLKPDGKVVVVLHSNSRVSATEVRSLLQSLAFDLAPPREFYMDNALCTWVEAGLIRRSAPRVSVVWSPGGLVDVEATLPELARSFPGDAELIISERSAETGPFFAQLEGTVTCLINSAPIGEREGIAQAAALAQAENIVVVRTGEAIEYGRPVSRESLISYSPNVVTGTAKRLAVAMNTRNEHAKIKGVFESVRGIDELVVGDMESTDDTVALALAAGARVINLPNAGYCEPGRQAIVDAPSCEWVLVLDADERLSPGGVDTLRRVIAMAPAEVASFRLVRHTYLGSKEIRSTGWDHPFETQQRLFRVGAVTWPPVVHTVPQPHGATMVINPDEVWIEHYAFDDLGHANEKFNRYSTIEAHDMVREGQKAPSLVSGLSEGVAEFSRRYNPDVDGAASFALSFGLLAYKFWNHAKALEIAGWNDASLPSAETMRQAWGAFLSKLDEERAARERFGVKPTIPMPEPLIAGPSRLPPA